MYVNCQEAPDVIWLNSVTQMQTTLSSLPFAIGYSGEAEIKSAFPIVKTEKANIVESAFRGRKLVGRILELPESLTGKHHSLSIHIKFV